MRKGESENVIEVFRNQLSANLVYVDATDRFLGLLEGVADPEQKRKIIGEEFIRVFEEEARKLAGGIDFLGQGTIYPDIVESGTKTAKCVKSHHNVGGLPEDLQFELVEPLKQLFKDEVRACGVELGLPYEMVYRQPFPGPGLGVVAWVQSHATVWKHCARAMPFCAKSSPLPDWTRRYGSTSPWCPTSRAWV